MRVAVLVKQVPDSDEVRMDPETGTMVRAGVGTLVNPLDLSALEAALRIRGNDGEIVVFSMGPPAAEEALREALALGADEAVLLTDRDFAGADTWATARTLAAALKARGPFDLLLAGEKATDGETGQVGPEVATFLGCPFATAVGALEMRGAREVRVRRVVEEGVEVQELPLPCLLTVLGVCGEASLPTLAGKKRARRASVARLSREDLGLTREETGLAGSPTRVVRVASPTLARSGARYAGARLDEGIEDVVARLRDLALLSGKRPSRNFGASKGADLLLGEASRKVSGPGTLVVGEVRGGTVHPVTFELTGKARELEELRGGGVTVLLVGSGVEAPEEAFAYGADRVLVAEHPHGARFNQEIWAQVVQWAMEVEAPEIVLAPATTSGRSVLPAVAARCGTGLTADCTELALDPESGALLQTRPAIGGNVLATIRTRRRPQMATVRPRTFPACARWSQAGAVERPEVPAAVWSSRVRALDFEPSPEGRANIQDEDVVVAGGKGLRGPEGFRLLEELATLLGGGVGASRPTVEARWIPYPHQVGLSGKVVAPKLYLAAGISGAVQHLAGMQTSGVVVAVNKDPEAPIFRVADVALCGDLFDVLPRLMARIRRDKEDGCGC